MSRAFWKPFRGKSLRQDWHADLPSEKSQVYAYALAQTERPHTMFSVALEDALMFRRSGKLEMARDQADLAAELCVRCAATLECMLNVVERYAHSYGLVPSVKPLDPEFFRGETAKRAAAMNSLLSKVLFKQSTCFLHKVRTLAEIAGKIADEYREMTAEVSSSVSTKQHWDHLSSLQFDLTTSLREAEVMLKSFIISLPPGEVIAFRDRLASALLALHATTPRPPQRAPRRSSPDESQDTPAVPDRRAATFRRE